MLLFLPMLAIKRKRLRTRIHCEHRKDGESTCLHNLTSSQRQSRNGIRSKCFTFPKLALNRVFASALNFLFISARRLDYQVIRVASEDPVLVVDALATLSSFGMSTSGIQIESKAEIWKS